MTTQGMNAAAQRELSELVVCTLNDTNLKTQRERWTNLGESFGIARDETTDGLRLTFKDHPAAYGLLIGSLPFGAVSIGDGRAATN